MKPVRLTVGAGRHGRRMCPVQTSVELPATVSLETLRLRETASGRLIAHQLWRGAESAFRLGWIVDDLAEGETATYELFADPSTDQGASSESPESSGVGVRTRHDELVISVGGEEFTRYRYGSGVARPYFYPVYAAASVGITRNWPMGEGPPDETNDHPHHKGLYTAQGEVNGVDNWSEAEGHGYQLHRGFDELFEGPVAGGFVERLDWTDRDRVPNLEERRKVIVYRTAFGLRMIDLEITFSANRGDVTFGDTKEAGLISVRVATSMDASGPDGGVILNSFGGTGERETWGKRATWCDYSGPIGSEWYGLCVMDHPENPRHPTWWHVRDYGLMTANCFGVHHFTGDPERRRDFVILDGNSVVWRYRVLIHTGRGELVGLTRAYHDFANPPEIGIG